MAYTSATVDEQTLDSVYHAKNDGRTNQKLNEHRYLRICALKVATLMWSRTECASYIGISPSMYCTRQISLESCTAKVTPIWSVELECMPSIDSRNRDRPIKSGLWH